MNTIKIIIHGTGTMSSILKNVIEAEEDLEVSGFADDLSNEKGDIIIDFSHFSRIPNMLKFAVNNNIPIVICTTGYDDKILSQIKEASSKIPILLSSNTSIGINLMNDLVSKMAAVLNNFDIEIYKNYFNNENLEEMFWISTNFTSQWCLNVIVALELTKDYIKDSINDYEWADWVK